MSLSLAGSWRIGIQESLRVLESTDVKVSGGEREDRG